MKTLNVRAFLQPTLFGRVNEDVLSDISSIAKVERYEVATLLNAAGTPLRYLRLVVEGHIEIVARSAAGKEVSVSDVSPGAWATWLPCFVSLPPEHDFYSSANATFIALSVAKVRELCVRYPALYPLIIEEIGDRMRLLMAWTGQSVLMQPEQRMAKLIQLLARNQKVLASPGVLNVTQARLARLARCSRQSANTLLGALEQKGLIRIAYGKCEIPDQARLAAFADASEED